MSSGSGAGGAILALHWLLSTLRAPLALPHTRNFDTIPPGEYGYRFCLIPYQPSVEDPSDLARGLFASPRSE